jgi:hemolysin type calcium-binding protein
VFAHPSRPRPHQWNPVRAFLAIAAVFGLGLAAPAASVASPLFSGASGDGSEIFIFNEALVTVDPTPPETTIDSGPSGPTNDPSPSFFFSSSEPGSSFECRLDLTQGADWQACDSPTSYSSLVDGLHTFEVRATDADQNTDQSPASSDFTVDTAAPDPPQITATDPISPANDNSPMVEGTAEADSTVRLFTSSDCTGSPTAQGSAANLGSPGLAVSVPDDSSTTFRAIATDAAGNASACSDPITYVEDSTPPDPPTLSDTDPDPPANDNSPKVKGSAEAGSTVNLYTSSACTGSPTAQGSAANLGSPGLAVSVPDDSSTTFRAIATDAAGNASACSDPITYVEDSTPPQTAIDSGPSGATNDPTPTFAFSSSEAGSSFECKVDSDPYATCISPKTASHGIDGSYIFYVRTTDQAGNTNPTPASRSFTIGTAAVSVSGSTIVVTAAAGAEDNLAITRPSASTLRVTDSPGGAYTGSGVHTGAGCTPSGDYTANCNASGITLITVSSADQTDQVVNSTAVRSSLTGGGSADTLIGGSSNDTLTGGAGADVMQGMNGNDQLLARDGTSDTTINCDGGGAPGAADRADLDLLPKDPSSAVTNCETKTRH